MATHKPHHEDQSADAFYDGLALHYEDIVAGAHRQARAEAFARDLVDRWSVGRVLDAACGTGLHARPLAALGVKVTAADISAGMIEQAKVLAGPLGENIEWVCCPMQKLSGKIAATFDAVLCLGNSLPHVLDDAELQATLKGFHALLDDGGVAVISLLNYAAILRRRERIVGISRETRPGADADETTDYVRFYDFLERTVRFNILEMHWQNGQCRHRLHQTELRPCRSGELAELLNAAGFARVDLYDGPQLGRFDPRHSGGLLIVARKQA